MNNETVSSLTSQLISNTYEVTLQVYAAFGALALLIYASFFHFPDEVQYIWKAKFTLPTWLYLLSKYPAFIFLSLIIYLNLVPPTSLRLCNDLGFFYRGISILPLVGTQGLISIRTFALCQGYQPMTIALAITFLTVLASAIYGTVALLLCIPLPGRKKALVIILYPDIFIGEAAVLTDIHAITLILLDTLAFIAVLLHIWGLWKLKQSIGLRGHKDLTTLLLHQGIVRFLAVLFMTVAEILLTTFFTLVIGGVFSLFQDVFSSLLLCEFTLDLRRRNAPKSIPNQSALDLPTLSFHENPVQSIHSALGRLHESLLVEMGERNDPPSLGASDDLQEDRAHDIDLDHDEGPSQAPLEAGIAEYMNRSSQGTRFL